MRQLILFTLLLANTLWASDNKLYLSTHYYDGLGQKFRVEKVVSYDGECKEKRHAEAILLDKTNELREIAYLDKNGIWKGGNGKNKEVLEKAIPFFKSATLKKSECLKEDMSSASEKSEEELIEEIKKAMKPLPPPPKKMPKEKLE
jgi:hypothetical protein